MRPCDSVGNTIAICSMENVDPIGAYRRQHCVAPALTLADKEYQMLRSSALKIIEARHCRGLQLQFALDPTALT